MFTVPSHSPSVHICLATYNAGGYLKEQLDSIQRQTYTNWTCLIRDDGSTDQTKEILLDYCAKDKRFKWINPENQTNLGSHRSFYELVKYQEADFYFFCDQDDVWKDNKIDTFLSAYNGDDTTPQLLYSSWTSVDESLTLIKENTPTTTLSEQLVFNQINGMSMMLNKELARLWRYRQCGLHDSYVATLAFVIGQVTYIPESTILWRRQSNAGSLANFGRSYGVETFWKMVHTSQERTAYLLEDYQQYMADSTKQLLTDFVTLPHKNILRRGWLLCRMYLHRKSFPETIAMNLLLLTNYKNTKN